MSKERTDLEKLVIDNLITRVENEILTQERNELLDKVKQLENKKVEDERVQDVMIILDEWLDAPVKITPELDRLHFSKSIVKYFDLQKEII